MIVVYLRPSTEFQQIISKQATVAPFNILCNSVFSNRPTIRRCVVYVVYELQTASVKKLQMYDCNWFATQ
jgi:hypothetical protein